MTIWSVPKFPKIAWPSPFNIPQQTWKKTNKGKKFNNRYFKYNNNNIYLCQKKDKIKVIHRIWNM